jgi:hypothetical protein
MDYISMRRRKVCLYIVNNTSSVHACKICWFHTRTFFYWIPFFKMLIKNKTAFHIFLLSYLFDVWYIHPLAYCVFLCPLSSDFIHPVDEELHRKVSSQKENLTIYLYPSCTLSTNHNFNSPRSGFSPRPVHVWFVVNKVALGQVSS